MSACGVLTVTLLVIFATIEGVSSCYCLSRDPEDLWVFWSKKPESADSRWGPFDDYECRGDYDFVIKAVVVKEIHIHSDDEEILAPWVPQPDTAYIIDIETVFKNSGKFADVTDKTKVYVGHAHSSCDIKLRENEEYLLRGYVHKDKLALPHYCSYGKPWGFVRAKRQEYLMQEGCRES